MLDIGQDTGALVVYASEHLLGEEIEIRPSGGVWADDHTAVRARHVGDRVLHAGIFGSLRAGRYDLRLRRSPHPADRGLRSPRLPANGTAPAVTTVVVAPGTVAETTLTSTAEDP